MLYLNSDHITLVIEYSELDEEGEHGPEQTANVHNLLDALKEDATSRAIAAYTAALALAHPSHYPASAVRPVTFPKLADNAPELLTKIQKAPPALALALGRKSYLPDERPGDEFDPDKFPGLMAALFTWKPKTINRYIGPDGWKKPTIVGTLSPLPKEPGPGFTLPTEPTPEPEPEPEIQFPPEPEPEPDPEPEPGPDADEPNVQEPEPNEPEHNEPPGADPSTTEDSGVPASPNVFPWMDVGKAVLGISAVGVVAYSLFGLASKDQGTK